MIQALSPLKCFNIDNFLQLIGDFDTWYPGNELIFQNKFPLLKTKLLSASEKISGKSTFVNKLKTLAKGEYFICFTFFNNNKRFTSHCWAQASSQIERAWAVGPTRAQRGMEITHTIELLLKAASI